LFLYAFVADKEDFLLSKIIIFNKNEKSSTAHQKSSAAHQRAAAHRLRNTGLEVHKNFKWFMGFMELFLLTNLVQGDLSLVPIFESGILIF